MNLEIKIEDQNILLMLKKGDEIADKIEWKDKNDLSLSLLKNLDKLLNRNKINAMDLKKSDVDIVSAGFSTRGITATVSKTVNYCLTK